MSPRGNGFSFHFTLHVQFIGGIVLRPHNTCWEDDENKGHVMKKFKEKRNNTPIVILDTHNSDWELCASS